MSTSDPDTRRSSGFPARLHQRIALFGSAGALAVAIQRSESAVRKWLRGQSEPSVTDLRALCEITQTRIDWLVTGRGVPEEAPVLRDPSPAYAAAGQPLELALLESVIAAVQGQLNAAGTVLSPLKHATLLATCYDLSRAEGPDAHVIARLVRLAM